jgi:hypothetical protein
MATAYLAGAVVVGVLFESAAKGVRIDSQIDLVRGGAGQFVLRTTESRADAVLSLSMHEETCVCSVVKTKSRFIVDPGTVTALDGATIQIGANQAWALATAFISRNHPVLPWFRENADRSEAIVSRRYWANTAVGGVATFPRTALMCLVLMLAGVTWRFGILQRRRRWHIEKRCTACGYDRAGVAGDAACPECGRGA